jgi:hypothetical protein
MCGLFWIHGFFDILALLLQFSGPTKTYIRRWEVGAPP